MIRAIIIDDEPLAIESLEIILKKKCRDDVQVIAPATPRNWEDANRRTSPRSCFPGC